MTEKGVMSESSFSSGERKHLIPASIVLLFLSSFLRVFRPFFTPGHDLNFYPPPLLVFTFSIITLKRKD